MAHMAATRPDTPVIGGEVVLARRRGKSKSPNFKYDGPVSVIGLELDGCDERTRRRLERQWEAVFGCAGRCSATLRRGVARIGPPTASAQTIRPDCGPGWG